MRGAASGAEAARSDPSGPVPAQRISKIHVGFMLALHAGAVAALAWFSWGAFFTGLALYVLTGLGITVGYHRLLAHRTFRATTATTRVLATMGSLALQGGPLRWVADHRQHHFHSDSDGDPHDIERGLFFAHMGWVFYVFPREYDEWRIRQQTKDLCRDPYLVWLEKYDFVPGFILGGMLLLTGGLPYFLWGFCVRLVFLYHSTWLVNSACHSWGYRSFQTAPGTNNWLVALLAFGEGWHNNHHAWPSSARHGLKPWEVDFSWALITALKKLRLVWDVTLVRIDASTRRGGVLVRD